MSDLTTDPHEQFAAAVERHRADVAALERRIDGYSRGWAYVGTLPVRGQLLATTTLTE